MKFCVHNIVHKVLNEGMNTTRVQWKVPDLQFIKQQVKITHCRSSGPGGQNVNKRFMKWECCWCLHLIRRSTQAEIRFHVLQASWVPDDVRKHLNSITAHQQNGAGACYREMNWCSRGLTLRWIPCLLARDAHARRKHCAVPEEDSRQARGRAATGQWRHDQGRRDARQDQTQQRPHQVWYESNGIHRLDCIIVLVYSHYRRRRMKKELESSVAPSGLPVLQPSDPVHARNVE